MQTALKQLIVALLCVFASASCKKESNIRQGATAPTAEAGPDQTIFLPATSITLDGSASTPGNRNITDFYWIMLSGPNLPTMSVVREGVTLVTNLVKGSYRFELTVTNAAGLFSKDYMIVTVLPASINDTVKIIRGPAMLARVGFLSEAKGVVPAAAADKLVFAGGDVVKKYYAGWEPTATVDIYSLSAGTWSTAQLSESRGGITVATVGNKILYAGGYNNGSQSLRVDIYDASLNIWSTAELGMARSQMTTAVAGNKVFFAGWGSSGFTDRVDIYDASSNSWSTATLSQARTGMSGIVAGNKVLFAGGYRQYDGLFDIPYDFSTRVDIYDVTTNNWTTAELKVARSGMAVAAAGNKILFTGGYNISDPTSSDRTPSNMVDMYDVSTGSWSATTLSEAREGLAAATIGNKIFFAGGGSNKVDVYDAPTNNWSTTFLSQPRGVSSAITLGTKVLFFTGNPNNDRLDIYDASSNTWSAVDFDKSFNSVPITAGNRVFIGGGTVQTVGSHDDVHFIRSVYSLEF